MSKRSELSGANIVGVVTRKAESIAPHMERLVDHVVYRIISLKFVKPATEPTGPAE